jgi:hypothetical protein
VTALRQRVSCGFAIAETHDTSREQPKPMIGAETPLGGGNMSSGVVRVGDTVRRPAGPWTPAVHALLAHLHAVGFHGAPAPLGIDQQGR